MKLLNTTTLHLKDFTGDKSRPPYAILSHTWGEEEVLYEDIMKGEVQWCHKTGATKVRESCKVAKSDRYECDWIWIDTCCIDKKSSAELSEAINSMYKWYSGSKICIAYLADVRKGKDSLSGSRWFTRGWTLQELIAPRDVDFWDRDWRLINNKFGAAQQIAAITNIDRSVLQARTSYQDLSLFYSVAQLMSWASGRRTTREEDISYSLLGLFNVNMPLLYGEGQEKAFVRLQMAIIEKCDDQSILAWGGDPQDRRGDIQTFARSPKSFQNCSMIQHTCRFETYKSKQASKAEKLASHHSIIVTQENTALDLIICPCREFLDSMGQTAGTHLFFGVLDCGLEGYHQLARPALLLNRASNTEEYMRVDDQLYVLSPDLAPRVPSLWQNGLLKYETCVNDWRFQRVSLPTRTKPRTQHPDSHCPLLNIGKILDQDLRKCSVGRHYRVRYWILDGSEEHGGVVSLKKDGYERAFVLWVFHEVGSEYVPLVLSEDLLRNFGWVTSFHEMLRGEDLESNSIWLPLPMLRLAQHNNKSKTTIRSGSEQRRITVSMTTKTFLGEFAPELKIEVAPLLATDVPSPEMPRLPNSLTDILSGRRSLEGLGAERHETDE